MKKAKLDLSEFMVLCRQEGYFNLSDISTAVFEYNGRLTILQKATKRPVTPEDMNLIPQPEKINTELIMDGRILHGNLKRMGLDINWLQKELELQGYKNPKQVFLALSDGKGGITVFEAK